MYLSVQLVHILCFFLGDLYGVVESHMVIRVVSDLWFYGVVLFRLNIHRFSFDDVIGDLRS